MRPIIKGSIDQSVILRIVDSGDGTPETGVTSATAGLALFYKRGATGAETALTESDLASGVAAHTDGGLIHLRSGYYRVDVPDAAFATGADYVFIYGEVTGMVVIGALHELVDAKITGDAFSRLGAPSGASVSADILSLLGRLTSGRATLLDNLDVAVSTRLATADYTAPPTAAAIRTEMDSNSVDLNTIITEIAVLTARLTAGRALLLDNLGNLDAAISSRLATAGYTAPPSAASIRAEMDSNSVDLDTIIAYVDSLETRLSAARALLLDNLVNLDVAVSSVGGGGGGGGGGATAAQVWDLAGAIDGFTPRQVMRLLAAAILGRDLATDPNEYEFEAIDESKVRVTGQVVNRKRVNTDLDAT